jgi:phospholipid/cholesterol/gamma-HCH transport system substrate-binding protein
MKKSSGNKLRLGILVSICFALFIVTIYFVGQRRQLFSSTFRISGIFRDISGLQVGNNVRYLGINVGIVENIVQLSDTTVKVDMDIDEETRKFIKKDAKALIGSDGLMGNKIVMLSSGTPNKPSLANNDVVETTLPVTMDDILSKIKISSDNAANITDDLAAIMNNIREGKGTIGKLFMDTTLANNLDKAIVNIKQGAGGFKNNMDAASHNVLLKGYFKKKEKEKTKVETNK